MNRHLSRSIVMQSLFEWDFNEGKSDIKEIAQRNALEFASGMKDLSFVDSLVDNVLNKQKKIDSIIEKAAPDWPIAKISIIDRNILRIGLYELLFGDKKDVPPKVALNEAIELAKTFGGEASSRFVNGVLGAVYKELGEPGKDDFGKKKKEVPYEKMPIEKKCGAVVYAKDGNEVYLALVHDIFGRWTLSKGGSKEGEKEKDCAVRKMKEEMGIDVKIEKELAVNEYIANVPEKGKVRRQVSYFLAQAEFTPLKLEEDNGGLDDAQWFKLADVVNLNMYDDVLPIVTKGINILLGKSK